MKLWEKFAAVAGLLLAASSTGIVRRSSPYPKGKGLFIDDLVREGKTPAALIERLRWLDISWLAVEIYWVDEGQENTHNLEDGALAAFVPELVAAGIEVWVWGFPAHWRVGRFAELTQYAYQVAPQVSGVIVDAEKAVYGPYEAEVSDLIARLKGLGKPVGVTSYPVPAWHPGFPWAGILDADFGMPMIYGERGGAFPDKSDDSWRELGFDYVIPINGGSSAHRVNDPDGFGLEQQAAASDTSDGGIGWWSYRHVVLADDSRQPERAHFIRNWNDWGGDG